VLHVHKEQINLALFQHFISCPKFHFSIKNFINNITENVSNCGLNKKVQLRITRLYMAMYSRSQF